MVASFAPRGVATDVFVRFAELVSLTEDMLSKSVNHKRKDDGTYVASCVLIVATLIRSTKTGKKINQTESSFKIS